MGMSAHAVHSANAGSRKPATTCPRRCAQGASSFVAGLEVVVNISEDGSGRAVGRCPKGKVAIGGSCRGHKEEHLKGIDWFELQGARPAGFAWLACAGSGMSCCLLSSIVQAWGAAAHVRPPPARPGADSEGNMCSTVAGVNDGVGTALGLCVQAACQAKNLPATATLQVVCVNAPPAP